MKKKLILILLICLSYTMVAFAQNRQIKVVERWWSSLTRSASSIPALSHDGNTIYIYSSLPLENMEVTVTDALGNMVYAGTLTVGADETISFTFNDTESGEYLIEITHGVKYLYGWFEVE